MIIKFDLLAGREGPSAHFEFKSNTRIYSIRIEIDNRKPIYEVSSCDCEFGSYWGHIDKFKDKGKVCRHLTECLKLLEFLDYINPKKEGQNGRDIRKETDREGKGREKVGKL